MNPRHPDNPDHDAQAGGLYRAMALRAFCRFNDLRMTAEFHGTEFLEFGPALTQLEACERYKRAVGDWLWEPPATAAAVLALLEFAGTIAGDKLLSEATREAGPVVSEETDAFHQVIALAAAGAWLNRRS